jgi:hypothetical protein
MRIVELQTLEGAWSDEEAIVNLSGKGVALFGPLKNESGAAFATVLAVALLRHRCAERQSSWRLLERKALAFLARTLGDPSLVERLISKAITLL